MKRYIVYFLYEIFREWIGQIVLILFYMVVLLYLKELIKFIGWSEVWATLIWGVGGILFFSWLNIEGYKIEIEKNRFEKWRNIIISDSASAEEKENAAWKMLRSKELKEKSLFEILNHSNPNTP